MIIVTITHINKLLLEHMNKSPKASFLRGLKLFITYNCLIIRPGLAWNGQERLTERAPKYVYALVGN